MEITKSGDWPVLGCTLRYDLLDLQGPPLRLFVADAESRCVLRDGHVELS